MQSTSGSWKGGLKRLTRTRARCKPTSSMLSRERLRESAESLLREFPERYATSGIERFVASDRQRRESVTRLEAKRRRRNELAVGRGRPDAETVAEMKRLKEEVRALEEEVESRELELAEIERGIPNVPHESVPRGKDDSANRLERTWGEPRRFEFAPLPHWDLGPALGILDFERAAKLAGARFTVLRGAGARLSRALGAFMLDLHTREHGYEEVLPPVLTNAESLFGTGQLPKFEDDLFKTREGLYLISTSETPVTNLHRDEILRAESLPVRYTAMTSCFRSRRGLSPPRTVAPPRRGSAPPTRAPLSRGGAFERGPRLFRRQDVRPRGLAAGLERVQRDLLVLELRGLPGAARVDPLPARGGREARVRQYVERLGTRDTPHPPRRPRGLAHT